MITKEGGAVTDVKQEFAKLIRPLYNSTPVSYTHLDVYKRQQLDRTEKNEERRKELLTGHTHIPICLCLYKKFAIET